MRAAARWGALAAVAFALNVVWELAQGPLYAGTIPTRIYVLAAVDDALLITAAAAGAGLLARWRRPAFWPVLVGALLATAAIIELRALAAERWSYTDAMPTVATIGLSPLLQLAVLGTIAVLVARPPIPAR